MALNAGYGGDRGDGYCSYDMDLTCQQPVNSDGNRKCHIVRHCPVDTRQIRKPYTHGFLLRLVRREDESFEKPVQIGDRLVFEDMAIYSMVKNNTFSGISSGHRFAS